MDALFNTAVAPPRFLAPAKLPIRAFHQARCSRNYGFDRVFPYKGPSQLLDDRRDYRDLFALSSNNGEPPNNNDVQELFNEAQRNILYLNKQRLSAMEKLEKCEEENQMLRAKVQELDAKVKENLVKGPNSFYKNSFSSSGELLLRIDAMVLSGLIGAGEASDFRRLIIDMRKSQSDVINNIQTKSNLDVLKRLRQISDNARGQGLHIVHVCTEMAPVTSNGSLASYVTGLSQALQEKGYFVEVLLPKYSTLALDQVWGLQTVEAEVSSYFGGNWHENRIQTGLVSGIATTFIEPLDYPSFFNRSRINGYADDFERFCYFSRAALDYLLRSGKKPDVLHIHNWETSIVGPLFWDIFVHQGLGGCRVLLTCHELKNQCLENPEKLSLCGLDPFRLHRPDRLQDDAKKHLVNILKGGVVYSNKVMISSLYSKESIIQSLSYGLEPILDVNQHKLLITPYGFDDNNWDPSKDRFLPVTYSIESMKGKVACKNILRQRLKFSGLSSAVVGCIYSDASETDLENLKASIWLALRKGAEVILLENFRTNGTDIATEQAFDDLKDEKLRFITKSDEALLRFIFAGSDVILCSSYHDPLHHIPLKAIKYGAVPIAVNVHDNLFRNAEKHENTLSKFLFSQYGKMSIGQALDQFKNDPSGWNRMITEGMSMDFSWNAECCDIHMEAYMSIKNL